MFERFTDRSRRVVVNAQEEASRLKHNYIGTEHLLLGLIREGEGVAANALESMGISLEAVRAQVEEITGEGTQEPTGHIPFTPRAKKVIELSLREALQLGHNYIGTEHLLLAIIREGEGVAAQVLAILGIDLSVARHCVVSFLGGGKNVGKPGRTDTNKLFDAWKALKVDDPKIVEVRMSDGEIDGQRVVRFEFIRLVDDDRHAG